MILSYVFIAIALIISVIIHGIIFRQLRKKHIRSMSCAFAYAVGLVFLVVLWLDHRLPIPITSILLYITASIGTIWFSFGAFLEGETPSSMILASYRKKEGKTEQELQRLFTTQGLIWERIDDLVSFGYVAKRKNRFTLIQKGKVILLCMRVYQKLFFRKEIG